jgi:hypothetical protein
MLGMRARCGLGMTAGRSPASCAQARACRRPGCGPHGQVRAGDEQHGYGRRRRDERRPPQRGDLADAARDEGAGRVAEKDKIERRGPRARYIDRRYRSRVQRKSRRSRNLRFRAPIVGPGPREFVDPEIEPGEIFDHAARQTLLHYDRISNRLFSNKYGLYGLHVAQTYQRQA